MEREGRGRRGEGGGEMRKGRRGIIVGGMVLGLLMGCNNGGEDPQKVFLKSVVSLGNEFLNIFTSFGEMAGSALGFKKDPQKSDVANYFKKMQETVQGTKDKLEKIVADMEKENNPNAAAVKTKVDDLIKNKLNNIIDGAKTASGAIGETSEPIGNVAAGGNGVAGAGAKGNDIENLIKGIKDIVKVVLGESEGSAEAGDNKKAEDLANPRGANAGESGKLFGNGANSGAIASTTDAKKAAADAAKAVGAVNGADILQAISKSNGDAVKLAVNNPTSAVTGVASNAKDGTIAGGIALRAMANGGKFANDNTGPNVDIANAVKGAAVSAVTKALDTLTIAIRRTIDEELKKVKEAMNINPETTPVINERAY